MRHRPRVSAASPEYLKSGDYLVHPPETTVCELTQGTRATRFHRGFFRAREAGQQLSRLWSTSEEAKAAREAELDRLRFVEWKRSQKPNLLTAAEPEPRREGVKMFQEPNNLTKEPTIRLRMGKYRFFSENPVTEETRKKILEREGFSDTHKESVILGIPPAKPRLRLLSVGVRDNFAHTQLRTAGKPFDAVLNRNASQIVFG